MRKLVGTLLHSRPGAVVSKMTSHFEGIGQVPILKQTQDCHFVLHWLYEHMPRYVMATLLARVNPEQPEMLLKKYGAKFADDVQNKRVLYGLQISA